MRPGIWGVVLEDGVFSMDLGNNAYGAISDIRFVKKIFRKLETMNDKCQNPNVKNKLNDFGKEVEAKIGPYSLFGI